MKLAGKMKFSIFLWYSLKSKIGRSLIKPLFGFFVGIKCARFFQSIDISRTPGTVWPNIGNRKREEIGCWYQQNQIRTLRRGQVFGIQDTSINQFSTKISEPTIRSAICFWDSFTIFRYTLGLPTQLLSRFFFNRQKKQHWSGGDHSLKIARGELTISFIKKFPDGPVQSRRFRSVQ